MKFHFDVFELFLYLVLGLAVLLYSVIFRRKISYLIAPERIINSSKKYLILSLGNFLPSLIISAISTALIREQIANSPPVFRNAAPNLEKLYLNIKGLQRFGCLVRKTGGGVIKFFLISPIFEYEIKSN